MKTVILFVFISFVCHPIFAQRVGANHGPTESRTGGGFPKLERTEDAKLSSVLTNPSKTLDIQSNIALHRRSGVIEISDISRWTSSFLNNFVANGGEIIFSGHPSTINGSWWMKRAPSITFEIEDVGLWNGSYLTKFVRKKGRIIYTGSPKNLNASWWIENARQITLDIYDIDLWNQKFLSNFSNAGGTIEYIRY